MRRLLLLPALLLATPVFALSTDEAQALQREIQADQKAHPAVHRSVRNLVAGVVAHPPRRERRAVVSRQFRSLGSAAALPMLGELTGTRLAGLKPELRLTLMVGMLEALREARDVRAAPLLREMVQAESDSLVAQTAAEALGALCRDEDVSFLRGLAEPGAPREAAALHGLGYCRSEAAALALMGRLRAAPNADVAWATGWLGSAWAWSAMPARRAEGDAIRDRLARALMDAWFAQKGELRADLGEAICMVAHPVSQDLLQTLASDGDEGTRQQAAVLLKRLQRTSSRR